MISRQLLERLKSFRVNDTNKNNMADAFPDTLATVLTMFTIRNIYGEEQALLYDWRKKVKFKINLGYAIANEYFDTFDEIILDFVKSYNYRKATPDGKFYEFKIEFPEQAIAEFESVCNAFKGRTWNDLLEDFINALRNLLDSATIHGDKFQ